MRIKCRTTHNLAEIKVDEVETTLWKSDPKEVIDMIANCIDVITDLATLIDRDFTYHLTSKTDE